MKALPWMFVVVAACSSSASNQPDGGNPPGGDAPHPIVDAPSLPADTAIISDSNLPPGARTIFVIPLENKGAGQIIGNTTDAPYINSLLATSASASNFGDELPALVSEPHYVWMEAGTNVFSDHTFTTDVAPSATNSTASTAHLVTQLTAANIPWTSYQQGITSGTCPIAASGAYVPKHDPFVFFKDVVGATPSASAPLCSAHHKAYTALAQDLQAGVSGYIFITGDLCHDMHGDAQCAQGTATAGNIKAGDTWLSQELPALINYSHTHDALIFIIWDEGDTTNLIPFLAIGTHVKAGVSATAYTHSSMLKSVEEYLGVPVLPTVAAANDFGGMFAAGTFP